MFYLFFFGVFIDLCVDVAVDISSWTYENNEIKKKVLLNSCDFMRVEENEEKSLPFSIVLVLSAQFRETWQKGDDDKNNVEYMSDFNGEILIDETIA